MIRIQAELKKRELKTRMLLQVHDELVFDCPKNEREEVQLLVKELMESAVETRIPLLAETGFGANWLEATKGLSLQLEGGRVVDLFRNDLQLVQTVAQVERQPDRPFPPD